MRKVNKVFYRKIPLPFKIKRAVLAMGSQTKNTLCFARDDFAYLSHIHANLNNPQDFLNFEKEAKYFLKKNPEVIAYDWHPEYQSSKYALNLYAIRYTMPAGRQALYAIQHHHAHIASCMAENKLKNQKVIGVAFDGTGLGSDNQLWGAEFLVCDYKNFTRCAHLKEIPLLGADMAILEPWRLAAIWLYRIYKDRFLNLGINFVKGIDKKKWRVLKNMYLSGFNSPLASSMGRLFDAAASLVLAKYKVNFEAELAMELEKITMRCACLSGRQTLCVMRYQFGIIKNQDKYIIDPTPMFKEIIQDLKAKEAKEKIAYRFHLTVAQMIFKICLILRKKNKINAVVLSGGVFGNNLLLRLSLDLLYKEDFQVFIHKDLTCNDSSISLGQAVIAGTINTLAYRKAKCSASAEGATNVFRYSHENKAYRG